MLSRLRLALATTVVLAATSVALAVRAPDALRDEEGLVVADQTPARSHRVVQWHVPHARTRAAWNHFLALRGDGWRAFWDVDTGVPQRIFGDGIATPGAVDSPVLAAAFAREVLVEHIDLLAPGSSPDDFVLVANDLTGPMRSVGFHQYHAGMRVLGGQLSFRFKKDRLFVIASIALPDIDAAPVSAPLGDERARDRATQWITQDFQAQPSAGAVDGPFVLPIVRVTGTVDAHTVMRVRVESTAPLGSWDVYLDASTGDPIARFQRLMFATGTVSYNAPERWWGGSRLDYPAFGASLTVNGASAQSDQNGSVTWSGDGDASVTARANGPLVRVTNQGGGDVTGSFTLANGGSYAWNQSASEFADAELTTYIHSHRVKQWARTVSSIGFLDDQLLAYVNINDTCNAYSDGTTINFFRAGSGCGNTGRVADIVYHEFGHSLHNHALIPGVGAFDGALSEGLSDVVAATITGSPEMGLGFFNDANPLRHCDPPGSENVWPDDVGEIHHTGKIYCGTLFDLRKNMIGLLGEAEGVAVTDQLFYESFRRADDIPSTYVEILAWDDDDGNLANGTPHQCEIDEAYARHGMADPTTEVGPRVQTPRVNGREVFVPVLTSELCAGGNVAGVTLEWELDGEPGTRGTVQLDAQADGYAGSIPDQPWGSVVRYSLVVTQAGGETLAFPANRADPMYELFIGESTALYCTDFESDPATDGWEHGLSGGDNTEGADDWQWDRPQGLAGDPRAAHSGERVYGNDLGLDGFNGEYQGDKVNYLRGPIIDTQGYDVVRLQYRRWLTVEDGTADRATIYANDQEVWSNLADGATDHVDAEWRFHDVDLSAAAATGSVQLKFELATNADGNLGGWTIDDVCVVAYRLPSCGNGVVEADEVCDDGNQIDGDGCDADCTLSDDGGGGDDDDDDGAGGFDGDVIGGCGCRAGLTTGVRGHWLLLAVGLLALRRRRR